MLIEVAELACCATFFAVQQRRVCGVRQLQRPHAELCSASDIYALLMLTQSAWFTNTGMHGS